MPLPCTAEPLFQLKVSGKSETRDPELVVKLAFICVKFVDHVDATLKLCSQRLFLLKQLRDQGMARGHLHTLFQAIVLNRITHAFPAWGPFLNIALSQRINGFLNDPIVMALLIMSLK